MAQRKGRGFGMRNPTVLSQTVEDSPPAALVDEVDRNGDEAGATSRDIFEFRGGFTGVLDNGHGMSPVIMVAKLCDFGASGKSIGGEGNLGSGPKIYALKHSLAGVQFFSKQGKQCYLLEWGENPDGFGPLEQDHTSYERNQLEDLLERSREIDPVDRRRLSKDHENAMRFVKKVECPKELEGYESGTLVLLRGVKHDQKGLLEWFNSRVVEPKGIVRIWEGGIKAIANFKTVRGLLPCLRELCGEEQFGVKQLKTATVYWGIMRPEEELKADPVEGFTPHAFYRSWQNLCYRAIPHSGGGSSKLARWGVPFGARRVSLVVVAKGRQIRPQPSRLDFLGWDEEAAIEEWLENFPEELEAWVDQAREDLPGPKDFDERVQDMVDRLLANEGAVAGAGGMRVGRLLASETPRRKNPFTRAGGGGGSGGSSSSGSSEKLGRGIRPILCDDPNEMDGERIRLDGGWLKINIKHPTYKRELDRAPSAIKRNTARMYIASEAVCNLIRTARELGVNPLSLSPETVKAVTASMVLVLYYLNGGEDRMRAPRKMGVK